MTEKKMREDKKRLNDFIAYADFVLEGHSQEFIDKYYDIICHDDKYDEWLLKLYSERRYLTDAIKILERATKFYSKRFAGVQLML